MSSRACIFAAVTLLVSCLAGSVARGQATNLEAGKSAAQLFAGTCTACHKSPRGLLKTVAPGALSGFLREHYTTGGDMASQLATYLISNGASDKSKQSADKPGADRQGQGSNDQADHQGRKSRNPSPQEAARPDDAPPAGENGRQGRRRQARPDAPEEGRPVANAPAQQDTERGADGRGPSAKQRSRVGKPPAADEPPMVNEPSRMDPAKADSGADDKAKSEVKPEMNNAGARPDSETKPADAAKSQPVKPEPAKSEAATIDAPKDVSGEKPMVPRDPATPAPSAVTPAPAAASASAPATAPGGHSEPVAARPSPPAAPKPSAMTASGAPPAPQSGPPAPPISQ
jgi:hypothetical protein